MIVDLSAEEVEEILRTMECPDMAIYEKLIKVLDDYRCNK